MTINDVISFEKMAKLNLPEDERMKVQEQVNYLVDSFTVLATVDTEGVLPLVTVLPMTNVLREDIVEKRFTREEILANAPEQYNGYFQVPKTLE